MSPQTTIAHYRIICKLGEGGMGAVYRATDTKLNRDVAIKVLPDAVAHDPDRMPRFTREAQVLASLNHPNIAAIYGVEERAIVMELVEGATPAGPIAVEQTLLLIQQLIDALEYAHDKGVVHRDLKPANLKITPEGRLKVLDFGLAKALASDSAATPDPASSPTLTMRATMVGVIMGTAAYMSPEQARGQNVDRRADIWAFGVVLYEMLTGKPLFDAPTVSDILALVLTRDPDLTSIPTRFHRLLRLCLTRDPRARLSHISAARVLLEEPVPEAPPVSVRLAPMPWITAFALTGIAAIALAFFLYRATRPGTPPPFMRLETILGGDVRLVRTANTSMLALSPDGTRLALTYRGPDGRARIGVRQLDQPQITPLPETEGGAAPIFSPDGQWIAFTADSHLRKVALRGGAAITLGELSTSNGGSWYGDDLYVTSTRAPIFRIPAGGGKAVPVTHLEPGEMTHRFPFVLPNGRALIFTAHTAADVGGFDEANVDMIEFASGRRRTLVHGGFSARYLASPDGSGYLLCMRRNTLLAVPFDADRLVTTGAAFPAVIDVDSSNRGGGDYAVTNSGTLVYREGHSSRGWSIYWMDASGRFQPLRPTPGPYYAPRLSPDGKLLAFAVATGKGSDIWVDEIARDAATRITNLPGDNRWMVWSADNRGIFFASQRNQQSGLFWVSADASAPPVQLAGESDLRSAVPTAISLDGKRLAVQAEVGPNERHPNIFTIPIGGEPAHPQFGKPELFMASPFNQTYPAFSPDGRWLAYDSNDTGATETYVSPFPGPGPRVQVSVGGGLMPIWSRTAHELFFRDGDQRLQVVSYGSDASGFHPSKSQIWSEIRVLNLTNLPTHDLAPDGKRMAVIPQVPPGEAEKPLNTLVFLLNFSSELRRRAQEAQ